MASKAARITSAKNLAWRPKPSISVDSRDLKAVKNMQIGKTYRFVVTAKVTSLNGPDDYDYPEEMGEREKYTRAHLRITKIEEE